MTEREQEPQSPEDILINKAQELHNESTQKSNNLEVTFPIYDARAMIQATDTFRDIERISNDLLWMVRLRKAGMSAEKIVNLYSLKEEDRHVRNIEIRMEDETPEPQPTKQKRTFRDIVRFKRKSK